MYIIIYHHAFKREKIKGLMRSKRLGTLGLVALTFATTSCAPMYSFVAKRTSIYRERVALEEIDKRVEHSGSLESIGEGEDQINVLCVEGRPYEMGFQQGKLLKPEIEENVRNVLESYFGYVRSNAKKVPKLPLNLQNLVVDGGSRVLLQDAANIMWPRIPREYQEELMGLADGSGVSLNDLKMLHALPEVAETSCSFQSAWGGATADGHLIQIRVLDFMKVLKIKHPTITVSKPMYGIPYANIGWAGFIGVVSGYNSERIGFSEAGYGKPSKKRPRLGIPETDYQETIHGMHMIFRGKRILQYASSVGDATAMLKAMEGTGDYAFLISDGKTGAQQKSRAFLSTKNFVRYYDPNGQDDIRVNGFREALSGTHDREVGRKFLVDNYGKINPKTYMQEAIPEMALKSNLHNVVYDLTTGECWISNSHYRDDKACANPYVLFDLGNYVEMKK